MSSIPTIPIRSDHMTTDKAFQTTGVSALAVLTIVFLTQAGLAQASEPDKPGCVRPEFPAPADKTAWGQTTFAIPSIPDLVLRAERHPHPRTFPTGEEAKALAEALDGPRKAGFEKLLKRVSNSLSGPLPEEPRSLPPSSPYPEVAKREIFMLRLLESEAQKIEEASFAWMITRDPRFLGEAKRRALALAAWDPKGASGYAADDLVARRVAWPLAIAFDWLHEQLNEGEKQTLLSAIVPRVADTLTDLTRGKNNLLAHPFNSHGNGVLGTTLDISIMLAGETDRASAWLAELLPLYTSLALPWGGDDGGYANGTAYALWNVGNTAVRYWDTLRRVVGIDLADKSWARNFGRFLIYFLPPGTPAGAFGDAAEKRLQDDWARFGKAYLSRVGAPLYSWYGRQLFGEDPSRLDVLLAPVREDMATPFPAGLSHSALFPSIGWAAFHSDLRDRGRTSAYFKSSPFGSYNHSHADQNSFTLVAAGRPLLIDSGYYDWYGSPHHLRWAKQTVAHNAITFDGGQGQSVGNGFSGDLGAKGKITDFAECGEVDFVTGDATAAYSGRLTRFVRSVAFLRPNTVVVFDRVESSEPRGWEWNIHALNKLLANPDNTVEARNLDARVCIDFHSSVSTSFRQSDRFPAEPDRTATEPRPNQWHGAFVSKQATSAAWFVAVLQVGCAGSDSRIVMDSNGVTATINKAVLIFGRDGLRLGAKGA